MLLYLKGDDADRSKSAGKSASYRRALLAFVLLVLASLAATGARADYPYVRIVNNTEYVMSGEVQYASMFCSNDDYSVGPGSTWEASSRGVCLVTGITGQASGPAKHGESLAVVSYDSTGTSYSQYQINAYGGSYRIFSDEEYDRVSDTRQGKSPGFYFVNETAWPIAYSLDQVGCLYHGIVPTGANGQGGIIKVDTGAVWFTLRMHIQADGQNPQSDWDCVQPVAELVADVAVAALSGGSTAIAQAGGKIVIKTVLKAAIKEGLKKAAKKIATKLVKDFAKEELSRFLTESGNVEMYGQYAGYEWPFRCDQMPEYHITGGPEILRDENGDTYLGDGEPLTITKTNDCGNDMMLASRTTMSAERSQFSSSPEAPAASNPTLVPNVDGSVSTVFFANGSFVDVGGGQWIETDTAGNVVSYYQESGRYPGEIQLFDAGRQLSLSLNVNGMMIWYASPGSNWSPLVPITGVNQFGASASAPTMENPTEEATTSGVFQRVFFATGSYADMGAGHWVETDAAGNVLFNFQETMRSPAEIQLFDASRQVYLSLNLASMMVWYAPAGDNWSQLYAITALQ